MHRRRRRLLLFALLLAPAILGAAAFWVLPRAEVPRAVALPEGDWRLVAFGEFRDGSAHRPAAGNVSLYEDRADGERLLHVRGYEARSGPNVWFHLTPAPDPADGDEVAAGIRLHVEGIGPAVARGDFLLAVPGDATRAEMGAVVAWDRNLGQRFAVARLDLVATEDPAGAAGSP